MKKQLLVLSIASISIVFIASDTYDVNSNGAPIASTGAPGESSCAKSGCHTGSGINSGAGILNIEYNNGLATYEPGKTYTVTVSMSQQNINRFGFQMLVLRNSDNTNVGAFQILDSTRTQVLNGLNQYIGRKYVTYKYPGTAPYSQYRGEWTFEWVAPSVDEGDITFYTAAVSANDDGTDLGDLVYTKALVVQPTVNGINEQGGMDDISVFPNPSTGKIQVSGIRYQVSGITVYNLSGEKVYSSIVHQPSSIIHLNVPDEVYFLQVQTENGFINKKVIIAH